MKDLKVIVYLPKILASLLYFGSRVLVKKAVKKVKIMLLKRKISRLEKLIGNNKILELDKLHLEYLSFKLKEIEESVIWLIRTI